VVVGVVALTLFTGGIHWLARSIRSAREPQNNAPSRRWKLRWTGAIVAILLISFAAGVSMVGVVHQVGWLATSERPLLGERLRYADSSEQNIKWIAIGVNNYVSSRLAFPAAATLSDDGQALHSWETQILHYMTYTTADIDKQQPWNSAVNRKYFQCVLPEFINTEFRTPQLEDDEGYGLSHYAGNSRVMTVDRPLKSSDVKDGESKTLLLGEVNANFSPWGRPFNVRDPSSGINCGEDCFGGPDARGGASFAMIDGSARLINADIDPSVLRALSTPADGNEPAGTE
jgi:hypothetical protein